MASALPVSSLSSYLYQKDSNKYGGKQQDYLKRAEAAVQGAVQMMRSSKDPAELFFKVFEAFRKERADIALKHGTEDAPLFGVLRNVQGGRYCVTTTPLIGSYAAYNEILMKQLKGIMSSMEHDLKTFKDQTARRQERTLDREVSCEVQVLGGNAVKRLQWDTLPCNGESQKAAGVEESCPLNQEVMKQLKQANPAFYRRANMATVLKELYIRFPSPKISKLGNGDFDHEGNLDNLKSLFAVGTLRLEVQGKLYGMSRFLTWLYQDSQQDPVDRMVKCSKAIIIHQDPFLIDDTLKEISQMFKKAVLWDPKTESIKNLKNRIALLRFTYAHCMPCFRGDGAIGDWLELALYRFHGFDATRYSSKHLPCFEPLASLSLSHYLGRYDQVITVEKSSESKEEKKEEN